MIVHIKRITAALVLFLGILMPLSSLAQVRSQRSSIEKHIKILNDKLKLNGGQFKKIKFILEDQLEETAIAINENRGNSQAADVALKEITKNTDNKIKSILNEKQLEAYDKIIEEREVQTKKQVKDGNN
jgi:hypothetical protein